MTSEALKGLAEFKDQPAPPQADTSDTAPATGSTAKEQELRLRDALSRLQTIMGVGDAPPLVLKPFTAPGGAPGGGGAGSEEALVGGATKPGGAGGEVQVQVLDLARNVWEDRDADTLKAGDVVKVLKTQKFPADLLLLHASSPTEVCIETSCFDRDTSLRHWQCVPNNIIARAEEAEAKEPKDPAAILDALGTGDTKITDALRDADMTLQVGAPRLPAEWERWETVLLPSPAQHAKGVEKVSFGYRQLLPFQAKLLVTEWVVGVVLFQSENTSWGLNGGEVSGIIVLNTFAIECVLLL